MFSNIRYTHTNIIAKDWRKLSKFYIDVFDCSPVYPERDLSGEWLDQLTTLKKTNIQGIHLKLPGYIDGPTLEIFSYTPKAKKQLPPEINSGGFSHIAFHVDDVDTVLKKLLKAGGEKYGEMVERELPELGIIKVIYTRDPEGNIIEIQNWSK